ncbi:aspartic proteinase nepenthesin-2 [Prunus persica]|uniref:aspartic proteinase nepenthesin-2 n=1 Tax=Prunus persica TaxID=3760 RepID=UPI0009ABA9BB|nr:aspartic proteinase nepenthesin-2 [Prunus persica]
MANPGLSIKLIHRDSQPNLTQSHRTQKLILLSKARAMRLTKDLHSKYINNSNANVVPAKIYYQKDSTYMAQVSIGTFRRTPPISYFLDVDTGSGIIWIQCQECRNPGHHCFYQRQPLSPLWNPFLIKNLFYDDGATSEGYLASETFNFDSNSTSRNVVFGYGINQIKMDSIAGSRLTIPANYFQRRSGRGGTIIDTGTAHTFLVRPAYEMLERALVNYFSRMPSVFRIHRQRFFNLCYQRTTTRGGFNNLPTIAFHLSNADLVVQPQGAFYLGDIFGR